jgi:putative endonuclease
MSKHNEIGEKGEQTAADFLVNKGYAILHRNWRSGKKEVDIIALKDNIVAIVEIKTRSSNDFAFPEEAVNKRKQQLLKAAAEAFMNANRQYPDYRFDIVSILMDKELVREIVHFEEAFH